MPPPSLHAALLARQQRLRSLGRSIARAAVVMLAVGMSIMAADPAGRELFGGDPEGLYASVPPELFAYLSDHGAAVRHNAPGWGHHGVTTVSPYGIYVLALLAAHLAFKWLIPSLRWRLILLFTGPIWFFIAYIALSIVSGGNIGAATVVAVSLVGGGAYFCLRGGVLDKVWRFAMVAFLPIGLFAATSGLYNLLNGQTGDTQSLTARKGVVSDRDGRPLVPPDGTVTDDPARLQPATKAEGQVARRDVHKGWATPYHLRPETLAQPLRDQAHYLLAQQGYIADDAPRTAFHLHALAGAWRPEDWHTRGRIGAMAGWVAAHGQTPGATAGLIADGAPYTLPRYYAGWVLLVLGCLGGTASLVLCILSGRLDTAVANAGDRRPNRIPGTEPANAGTQQ
ncbi:hypothetical protein KRR38_11000 [Novosphingobium sp. G106]|uniref:hypothetical protein n=1 Tax=Novosphingobium sp. G106 TaxID=2849500 RepID=UPI001C2D0E0A|nr:hypothetical protein [Novosphingobium sp. G106]MBV1688186.1 hypothetical protein [Novosphingobium sp. G106]